MVKREGEVLKVIHVKRFSLETNLGSVLGYLKILIAKLSSIEKIFIDQTGMGEMVVEEARNLGLASVEGITFTMKSKEEMASLLKNVMEKKKLLIPYNPDFLNELNVEQFEITKDGHFKFSHPQGTHDDLFWALALAVYASVQTPLPGKGAAMLPH